MKKLFVVALFAVMSLAATAQAADHRVGIDGAFGIQKWSVGGSSSTYMNVGGLVRYEYMGISPQLTITGRVGYLFGLEKDSVSISYLPILAGVKWYFTGYTSGKHEGFYAAGELGFNYTKVKVDYGFGSVSGSENYFGLTAGAGYEFGFGMDVRAAFFAPSLADLGDLIGGLITVGWSGFEF
jgi:hypothetical protein